MCAQKTLRICDQGHRYYKASDCPTCPICDKESQPTEGFLAQLSSPARRALLHNRIDTVEKLSTHTEREILTLHGIGKASLPALRKALQEKGLRFKRNDTVE